MSAPRCFAMRLCVWIMPVLLAVLVAGCASRGGQLGDDPVPPEIARIPDAKPKVEPLSKQGNPKSYIVAGKRYAVQRNRRGYVERGLASWYGKPFHGRKTSSGETYDMHAMSAAHKTLPLPTYARVTNIRNGRSIVVRINDRGPFRDERIIDLSHTAAVKLGVVRTGVDQVEIRAIEPSRRGSGIFMAAASKPAPAPARPAARTATPAPKIAARSSSASARGRPLYLQIGAFGDPQNAERLRARLTRQLLTERIRIFDPNASGLALYTVRIGPLDSEHDAERLTQRLVALGVERPQRVWN